MAEEFKHVPKDYDDAATAKLEKEHEERTKVKNVDCIYIGKWKINTWYFSPFPQKVTVERILYYCEFCLIYTPTLSAFKQHMVGLFKNCS